MLNNLKKITLILLSSLSLTPLTFNIISLPTIEKVEAHHIKTTYRRPKRRLRRGGFVVGNQHGVASFYGIGDGEHGKSTASGVIFNRNSNMCAHNSYPFGTRLRVINVATGRSTICKVSDRGGFGKYNRIIDLSSGSFQQIAPLSQGLVNVRIKKVD